MSVTGKIGVLPQNIEIESDSQKMTPVPFFFLFFCTLCMAVLYSNILTYHMTVTQIHSYGNNSANDCILLFLLKIIIVFLVSCFSSISLQVCCISAIQPCSNPQYRICIYSGTFLLFLVFLLINYDDEFKDQASREGLFNALFTYERSRSRILSLNLPYLSIYQVVGMSIVPTGLLLMIPPTCNIFTSFFVLGVFPKLANAVPNKLRVFNSLGMIIPGVLFMLIGVFDPYTQSASVATLFILASSLLGFVSCGFFKMNQLRSKQYHLFLLANLFLVNCVSMFLTSLFNVLIAKNDEYTTWGAVLILHGAILIVCNIVFCLFASEDAADWTKEGFEDTSIQPRREDPLPLRPL
uniref:Transmembrane protein n=1 Tax=Heterorhabditis bacteriophora TaxID=37862 RepID=A0A1I7WP35_HETBA